MLICKNVSKFFNKKPILHNISLALPRGSLSVFIGSSGVGKSTLLRILCSLETYDTGSITIDDKPLRHQDHTIGMVFQHFNLFSNMNVITNITLPLEKILGYAPKTAQLLAMELLHKYDLADKATLCIKKLSGGQKQRLAVARTLALKPDIICFDEPTSALDPSLTMHMISTITDLSSQGFTIIIASHDTLLLEKLPCMLYLLKQGSIIETAQSSELQNNPLQFPLIYNFIKGHKP